MPVSGEHTNRHGGHTLCVEINPGGDSLILIDGGTGITRLERNGTAAAARDFHVFLTHYHWDHIQGLLFFRPLYDPANSFTFYGHGWNGLSAQQAIEGALQPPWFPVSIQDTEAKKTYVTIEETSSGTESVYRLGALQITAAPLQHPQGVTSYRIDGPNRSVVIATDCERGDPVADERLRRLAAGADILVHDAQYSPDEYEHHYVGWGHSTWAQAIEASREAGVQELILVSHDPARSDDEIDELVRIAQQEFPNTSAAREQMRIEL